MAACGFLRHVHNYERFTRTLDGKQIAYVVAGCGGHNPLSKMRATVRTPYKIDSTLTLNSTSKIVENKAAGGKDHGGGIYNEKGSTLNLDGGTVNKNTPENIFEEP